jgi:endonuclease/exonuclease/phosphatase family metal-dependent hydrolase
MVSPLAFRVIRISLIAGFLFLVASGCAQMFNYLEQEKPRFAGDYAVTQPDSPDVITIASYNIKLGDEVERALAELTRHKRVSGAEILLLQEMDEEGTERIARTLAYNYVYYPASVHTATGRNFGNAILSRYPIKADEKILLPHGNMTRGQRRIAVRALLEIETVCVQVYSVHTENLSLEMDKRLEQVDTLLSSVSAYPYAAIVGGDFNTIEAPALTATVGAFGERAFEWASEDAGTTASFSVIDVQSDHIFTRGVAVRGTGQIETANASDHKPIWVDVSLIVDSPTPGTPLSCQLSGHPEE